MIRALCIAALLLVAGCQHPIIPLAAVAAADVAAIPVIHRSLFDAAYSAISGRDCSIVRLDRMQSYCRPTEPPPVPPQYCTRSLGVVDCWADPSQLAGPPPPVADGPSALTPAQEADRTARWPPI